jgi:arsenite methyltransferase
MSSGMPSETAMSPAQAADTKQCCARLYESEIVSQLLGDSFHPGGAALTERLGQMLGLMSGSHVLDAASGTGTSAVRPRPIFWGLPTGCGSR